MQRAILVILIVFTATAAHAQIVGGLPPRRLPTIAPVPFFWPSMSVIDSSGNLLIFDVNYKYPVPLPGQPTILSRIPAAKTRLTVVRNNGQKDAPKEFDGAMQIVGAGFYSVYVVTSSYSAITSGGTAIGFTTKRQLVAINVESSTQPAPIDVPPRADVRLAAATDAQHLDTLSFVDPPSNPLILTPTVPPGSMGPGTAPTVAPIALRFARLITCDGKSFNATDPVPIP